MLLAERKARTIKKGKIGVLFNQPITRVWQKWRFSAPQTHLWIIKVWFSASTFVVKIATFAKPETVMGKFKKHSGSKQADHL
jgi:hypothetical protein